MSRPKNRVRRAVQPKNRVTKKGVRLKRQNEV